MDSWPLLDVQHLLRYLDDPRMLRETAIVADLFAGVETPEQETIALTRVRALVTSAVRALRNPPDRRNARAGRYAYEILDRCDLQGELHRVVASDLGLAERQFYRARRNACMALGRILASRRTVPTIPAAAPAFSTTFAWQLECAQELQGLGQLNAALTLLRGVAAKSSRPLDRVRAWCQAAHVFGESGDSAGAYEALASARDVSLMKASPYDQALAAAEVNLMYATLFRTAGKVKEAALKDQQVLDDLRSFEPQSKRGIELATLALLDLSTLYTAMGATSEALAAVAEGRTLLARLSDPPAVMHAQLDISAGIISLGVPGGLSNAERLLQEALAFARRARLARCIVDSSCMLSIVSFSRGDFEQAKDYGRAAFALAQTVSAPQELNTSILALARAELMAGDPSAAMALTAQARLLAGSDVLCSAMTELSEAEVLLCLQRPRRAVAIARAVIERIESLGAERYLGVTLQILARALAADGDVPHAIQSIDSAIAILERYGHPFSLARAYACSATLTGNARHRRYSRDLYATLRA